MRNKHDRRTQKEKEMDPRYKTQLCEKWIRCGECECGIFCLFAHGEDELRKKPSQFTVQQCMTVTYVPTPAKEMLSLAPPSPPFMPPLPPGPPPPPTKPPPPPPTKPPPPKPAAASPPRNRSPSIDVIREHEAVFFCKLPKPVHKDPAANVSMLKDKIAKDDITLFSFDAYLW